MNKKKILIQLDADTHPSVFDRVVAVDSGVDYLFSYGAVTIDQVENLVHGAMFTRGPQDLKNTAIFIGGSNVDEAEKLMEEVKKTFFEPLRVSVMFDANGANTTAAAAVLSAGKHVDLANTKALVLGGTGPVGQRASLMLANEGAKVLLASRSHDRAKMAAASVNNSAKMKLVEPVALQNEDEKIETLKEVNLVISAGKAGVQLISQSVLGRAKSVRLAIDLNAVPPSGIEPVDVMDAAKEKNGIICYGAIGVGGLKMDIHKESVRRLFTSNDLIMDAEGIYSLGKSLL